MRCVIGTLPLAIQTNALTEEPLVRVPGGWSANLPFPDYGRVARHLEAELAARGCSIRGEGLT